MGRLSRSKGKRCEREAAKAVAEAFGCDARRSAQYCGKAGDADLQTSIEGVHIEVKARRSIAPIRFYEQAASDAAAAGALPIVLLREDGDPSFYALMRVEHIPSVAERIAACRSKMS
jgi:hypothetical protein